MRLIDADLLKEKAKDYFISPDGALKLIEEQATAYDVDNVCKKINENKDIDNLIDADHAIKIIKKGGIHG